jgi:ABC-type sulfate transport system permease component
MLRLAPQAINASLFRPYLWEAKNPLMLMAAMESLFVLGLTLVVAVRKPGKFLSSFRDPYVMFCIVFSITFAFAVGVSTFNFGTLVRYKIPMLPFYLVGLMLSFNRIRQQQAEQRSVRHHNEF